MAPHLGSYLALSLSRVLRQALTVHLQAPPTLLPYRSGPHPTSPSLTIAHGLYHQISTRLNIPKPTPSRVLLGFPLSITYHSDHLSQPYSHSHQHLQVRVKSHPTPLMISIFKTQQNQCCQLSPIKIRSRFLSLAWMISFISIVCFLHLE